MKLLTFLMFIGFFCSANLYGQGNNLKAKLLYEEAEVAYSENNFEQAFEKAKKAEELLGNWTPKTGYMKIIALDELCNYTTLEDRYTKMQRKEVDRYMKYVNANEKSVDIDKVKRVIKIEDYILFLVKEDEMTENVEGKKSWEKMQYADALKWFKKGADKGSAFSMYCLGRFYEEGIDVEKNVETAMQWYQKAALKGDPNAIKSLAVLLFHQNSGNKEAGRWMKILTEKGDKSMYSSYGLNLYYQNNLKEAIIWLKKGLQFEDELSIYSMEALGSIYLGLNNTEYKDINESIKWFETSANKGFEVSMFYLGYIYQIELQDYKQSIKWYKMAGDKGNATALYILGSYYQFGFGTTIDYSQAMDFYLKSASLGNINAMTAISVMYKDGYGVKKDKKIANEWKKKAEVASETN
ncbi:tetratricopeptide repeat protein [Flavobacterium orientale]|nr:tetratricopeptide repeat protein [Flavobacterium orientale]